MLRALPTTPTDDFVVVATKRPVVGWRMGENFEIALPDRVELREVDVECEALDGDGEPVFESILVDHADGTRTRERRRKRETKRVKERIVLSHGGTVSGPKGAWLVRDVESKDGWYVVGAVRESFGVWRVNDAAAIHAADLVDAAKEE